MPDWLVVSVPNNIRDRLHKFIVVVRYPVPVEIHYYQKAMERATRPRIFTSQ